MIAKEITRIETFHEEEGVQIRRMEQEMGFDLEQVYSYVINKDEQGEPDTIDITNKFGVMNSLKYDTDLHIVLAKYFK